MGVDPAPGPSPFATVREMYVVKDTLLVEMHAMEGRITARIDATNARLDANARAEAEAAHFRAGQVAALSLPLRALDAANRYRWLVAIAIGGVAFLTERIKIVVMP